MSCMDTAFSGPGSGSDVSLIVASQAQPEVFAGIFDRHFGAIHRYLARRVGSSRADDLASQSFVVAFERRASFDPSYHSARPWLFGIASNLMRNDARSERRLLAALAGIDPRGSGELDEESERTLARVEASAEARRLAGLILALDSDQRDVLLLHAWAELSYEEISQALSIPIGTVRSRLARARSRMGSSERSVASISIGNPTHKRTR